jgi:5-formyltetrahydrofolate cyclo-ligase
VLVIPTFAVSLSGIRLGKGGGFYDRLLANIDPKIKKIALIFDTEIFEEIPHEPHDKKVDFIVSEKRVLTIT